MIMKDILYSSPVVLNKRDEIWKSLHDSCQDPSKPRSLPHTPRESISPAMPWHLPHEPWPLDVPTRFWEPSSPYFVAIAAQNLQYPPPSVSPFRPGLPKAPQLLISHGISKYSFIGKIPISVVFIKRNLHCGEILLDKHNRNKYLSHIIRYSGLRRTTGCGRREGEEHPDPWEELR